MKNTEFLGKMRDVSLPCVLLQIVHLCPKKVFTLVTVIKLSFSLTMAFKQSILIPLKQFGTFCYESSEIHEGVSCEFLLGNDINVITQGIFQGIRQCQDGIH